MPLAFASSAGVAAHDEECTESLRTMPIETIELPDDMVWRSLAVNLVGGLTSTVEEATRPTDHLRFSIVCVGDAVGWLEANGRLDAVLEHDGERRSVAITPLGDHIEATRAEIGDSSNVYIQWANGPLLVDMSVDEDIDWHQAEDIALAIDALLP